jgi:two-component system, sensor histidine kinase and response regulator
MVEPSPFVALADRPLNILLADDDPIHCAVAEQWLTGSGNELCEASDGREALAFALGHQVDLVILDLEMPQMDGCDVLSELRADPRYRKTPIVVITGRRDTFAIDKAYDRGATSFVVKPVVWPLLIRQLRYVVNAERMSRGLSALSTALA